MEKPSFSLKIFSEKIENQIIWYKNILKQLLISFFIGMTQNWKKIF